MQRIADLCKKQRSIENMLRITTILIILMVGIVFSTNYNAVVKDGIKFIFGCVLIFGLIGTLIVCNQIIKIIIGNAIKKEVLTVLEDEIECSENRLQIKKTYVKIVWDRYIIYIASNIDEYTKQCINNRLKYLFVILQRALKKRISIRWI